LLLTENTTGYTYPKFEFYSDGYKDWGNQNNLGQVNTPQVSDNWRVLQGTAKVEGELFGGCIEVLEFMKSTEFWPNSEFWNGKILFFETSEEKPTPDVVKRMLRNYGSQGIFSKVNGLLFGRARSYSEAEKKDLDSAIISVVKDEFENSELPIISNMNFGHTDPQFILPLGVKAELNPKESSLVLLESALS
jgi:muramoyltetrapeptide carboxypeptidase LdcA involved in peptidoglycan recycling